ncbi:hypothetical protein HK097_010523 [Rhizophlyctis rosea]|uniref:Uncharacterized protein n=1 Tax=Rhizophlyctis rosea TaxID=64517 RepID=A0AAD5SIU6_9FUNG|nr:hypothetical protein HK097_010523 [Rhizophlyctis rosea]
MGLKDLAIIAIADTRIHHHPEVEPNPPLTKSQMKAKKLKTYPKLEDTVFLAYIPDDLPCGLLSGELTLYGMDIRWVNLADRIAHIPGVRNKSYFRDYEQLLDAMRVDGKRVLEPAKLKHHDHRHQNHQTGKRHNAPSTKKRNALMRQRHTERLLETPDEFNIGLTAKCVKPVCKNLEGEGVMVFNEDVPSGLDAQMHAFCEEVGIDVHQLNDAAVRQRLFDHLAEHWGAKDAHEIAILRSFEGHYYFLRANRDILVTARDDGSTLVHYFHQSPPNMLNANHCGLVFWRLNDVGDNIEPNAAPGEGTKRDGRGANGMKKELRSVGMLNVFTEKNRKKACQYALDMKRYRFQKVQYDRRQRQLRYSGSLHDQHQISYKHGQTGDDYPQHYPPYDTGFDPYYGYSDDYYPMQMDPYYDDHHTYSQPNQFRQHPFEPEQAPYQHQFFAPVFNHTYEFDTQHSTYDAPTHIPQSNIPTGFAPPHIPTTGLAPPNVTTQTPLLLFDPSARTQLMEIPEEPCLPELTVETVMHSLQIFAWPLGFWKDNMSDPRPTKCEKVEWGRLKWMYGMECVQEMFRNVGSNFERRYTRLYRLYEKVFVMSFFYMFLMAEDEAELEWLWFLFNYLPRPWACWMPQTRWSTPHRDNFDVRNGLCWIYCWSIPFFKEYCGRGKFEVPALGLTIPFKAGDIIALRSYLLDHFVSACEPGRGCSVFFTHNDLFEWVAMQIGKGWTQNLVEKLEGTGIFRRCPGLRVWAEKAQWCTIDVRNYLVKQHYSFAEGKVKVAEEVSNMRMPPRIHVELK